MKIRDIFKKEEQTFSFEFFPPKDTINAVEFGINIGQLLKLDPSFVTVTYGAGGTTQETTFNIVDLLQNKLGLSCMAHYTCVGADRNKIKEDLKRLESINIENLMLLRGDPPKGSVDFQPPEDGFAYANELIDYVKEVGDFSIGAAAYPEKHFEAASFDMDIDNLKKKVDAGADFLVTQMFFDNQFYFDFADKCKKAGIEERIIPGIIPITNYSQIKRFLSLSNSALPPYLEAELERYKDDDAKVYEIGIEHAIKQCKELLRTGAPGIHFYTLNKSRAVVEIFESIKRKPAKYEHIT